MIAYLFKSENGLAVFTGDGEECLDRLRTLARSHRLLIWRHGDKYVAMQGEVSDTLRNMPFRDVSSSAWNTECRRWLRGGEGDSRGVCNTCGLRDDCWRGHGGPQGAVPDARSTASRLGYNATAVAELALANYEWLWSQCELTEEQALVSDSTLTAAALESVGFQVVTRHRLLDLDGARSEDWLVQGLDRGGLNEESPIAEILKAMPRLADYNRGARWGREMSLSDLDLGDEVYQINRVKARVRADKGVKTKSGNKDFQGRECSRCVYGCQKPPWRHSEISRCHVVESDVGEEVSASWLYHFTFPARVSDDFPLGVDGRKRKGIVFAPVGDEGLRIVSRVYPYSGLGEMNVVDVAGLMGVDLIDPETWLADYRARNPGLRMELVSWALRAMLAAGRDIRWYGDGRGKRNDVMAIQLRERGEISVATDTSSGGGYSPRFRFSLVYPYFESFRTQLFLFPGAGRRRW